MQHITYTEYLPLILDPAHLAALAGPLQYDPKMDASIANSFSTAALRFGHSTVPETLR